MKNVGPILIRSPTPAINKSWVKLSFSRSGGKGGQNVNKVNSQCEARLEPQVGITHLGEPLWEALKEKHAGRFTKEDHFVVTSSKYRTQHENIKDVLGKMQALIVTANLQDKERIATASPEWANEKRIQDKKKHGDKKKTRGTYRD